MVKRDTKLILKSSLLFGGMLAVLNIITMLILQGLRAGKSKEELIASITIDTLVWDTIRIGLLVWGTIYLARRFEKLKFWKLIAAAIGIVVLDYHFFYLYDLIDYYLIQGHSAKEQTDALGQLLNMMEGNSKPNYAPIFDIIGLWFYNIQIYFSVGAYEQLFYQLILGTISLPVWTSIIVFFSFRKKPAQ